MVVYKPCNVAAIFDIAVHQTLGDANDGPMEQEAIRVPISINRRKHLLGLGVTLVGIFGRKLRTRRPQPTDKTKGPSAIAPVGNAPNRRSWPFLPYLL